MEKIKQIKEIQNITLESINSNDFRSILEITSNPEIMKNIGDSKPWNPAKVKRFIDYCKKDSKISDSRRQNYYYKIVTRSFSRYETIGIIGFHLFNRKEIPETIGQFYLTVYIKPEFQGKGVYSTALELLINKFNKHQSRKDILYILVRKSNELMNKISAIKYQFIKDLKLNQEEFNLYGLNVNNHQQKRITSRKNKRSRNIKQSRKIQK